MSQAPHLEGAKVARRILDQHDGFEENGDQVPEAWDNWNDWMESRVASLLCDLRLYCHTRGVDYHKAEDLGYLYYQDKMKGE